MNNFDQQYKELIKKTLTKGKWSNNRTGIRTISIPSAIIQHDMAEGFPLLTLRRLPYKATRVELEGFIKGISSKKWYQDRGCKYWNEWCNPKKVKYGNDSETKAKMLVEDDLGIIYGNNWRDFRFPDDEGVYTDSKGNSPEGIDQLQSIVKTLKKNPNDRRMLCLAWNPLALDYASLPACHFGWQVLVIDNKLHLNYFQRSTDGILGAPANLSSYATLLHLLAKEGGFEEGQLTAFMSSFHIYENQLDGVDIFLDREPLELPRICTEKFVSIFNWTFEDTELLGYNPHDKIQFEVAV